MLVGISLTAAAILAFIIGLTADRHPILSLVGVLVEMALVIIILRGL